MRFLNNVRQSGITICDTRQKVFRGAKPFAATEQGIAMIVNLLI